MSSRPECNFCNTYVTMGSCSCGRNIFGPLTPEEEKEQAREYKMTEEEIEEQRKSWVRGQMMDD